MILTYPYRHHNLFQCRIASPFPNAIDRAFHLPRARRNRRHCIRHGHAKIVMAVRRDHDLLNSLHIPSNRRDGLPKFVRDCESNRVRNIQSSRTSFHYGFQNLAQKIRISSRCIFRRKFHVIA